MSDPIMISFFAHKGGVGKTTAIHNFASVLVEEFGLKVLLVDADAQCSLTSVVMKKNFAELKKNQNDPNLAGLTGEEIFYETRRCNSESRRVTLYECFETADDEFQPLTEMSQLKTRIESIEPVKIIGSEGLLFIPGDLMTLKLDTVLSHAFSMAGCPGFKDRARYPGVINYTLRQVAKRHEVNIILVDLNPGATAFTQSIVLGSDYFILCNLPDYYSRRAVQSLKEVLLEWEKHMGPFRNPGLFENKKELMMPELPKFLGSIFNRVKFADGKPSQDQKSQVEKISEAILEKLIDGVPNIVVNNFKNNSILIKEFDRTYHKAIEQGIPMSYTNFNKVKSTNITKSGVEAAQKVCFNAFYSAVLGLLCNLSDKDHVKLNNMFKIGRPTLLLTNTRNSPEESESEDALFEFPRGDETLKLKGNRINYNKTCVSSILSCGRDVLGESLIEYSKKPEILKIGLIKEIYDAYRKKESLIPSFVESNGKFITHTFPKLCEDFAKNFLKQKSAGEGGLPPHLIAMPEIERLLQINFFHHDLHNDYLEAFFNLKTAEIRLINLLKSPEIIANYAEKIKKGEIKAGITTLMAYSEVKGVNMQIFKKKDLTSKILELIIQNVQQRNGDDIIYLLHQEWNNFNKLTLVRDPPFQKGEKGTKKVKTNPNLSETETFNLQK